MSVIERLSERIRRRRAVCAVLVLVLVLASVVGCSKGGGASDSTGPTVNYPNGPDVTEWASKKGSLEEAGRSLGATISTPADTRGNSLKGIYVTEVTTDGKRIGKWDQAAVLDYGDFRVTMEPQPSAAVCRQLVESDKFVPGPDSTGHVSSVSVGGSDAVAVQRISVPLEKDASGKVVQIGIEQAASFVRWSRGNVSMVISSKSLSADELIEIAQSIK